MRIIKLEANNVKRIKAVEITPVGHTVTISGKNDQGKTSILDSIEYALAGNRTICEKPVRLGEAKARIVCDLGDIVVERRFTASGGTSLEVRDAEGVPQRSPQAILDSLCQSIAFDPLEFVRSKPPKQLEILRQIVKLDFTELNTTRQRVYDERTQQGRQLENAKGRLTAYPFEPNAPMVELSLTELTQKLVEVKQKNQEAKRADERIAEKEKAHTTARQACQQLDTDIEELERQLTTKRASRKQKLEALNTAADEVTAAKAAASALTRLDESAVQSEIDGLQEQNARVRKNALHLKVQEEITGYEGEIKHLTSEIERLDYQKQVAISQAAFPLPGLSLDDSGVLLNGVPFTQGSQAKQLQAAVAIGIALNPKIRVILIRDASLLDDDSMKLIHEMAVKNDVQIWLEVVGSKDPTAVVIEDGEVVEF